MANKIQIKRGNKSHLPALSDGELAYCKDTKQLYIGNAGTNVHINPSVSGAPLNSPKFTGVPTAPTASRSTNNTQIATTAFVKNMLGDVKIDYAGDNYITLSNGTQICWGTKHFGNMAFPNHYAPLYASNELTFNYFPVSFADAPVVSVSSPNIGWITTLTAPSMSNPGGYCLMGLNGNALQDCVLSYIAIGQRK